MTLPEQIERVTGEVAAEVNRAISLHSPMHSYHEGYAVILEELEELFDEIKCKKPDPQKVREEALQVAAMADRFVVDRCNSIPDKKADKSIFTNLVQRDLNLAVSLLHSHGLSQVASVLNLWLNGATANQSLSMWEVLKIWSANTKGVY